MSRDAVVGLELGSKTIKAVEIERRRDRLVMTRAAVRPTPDGMVIDGYIIDADAIGQEVSAMLRDEGFSAKRAVVACGGQTDMVVRITEVPRMSAKDLRNAMKYDLERHLPFPPADARDSVQYSVYEGPDVDPTNPNMEVTITALKDEACTRQLNILNAARLKPLAVDAEPFAIGRALVSSVPGASPTQCVAIANIGSESTDIYVVHNSWLRFMRSIPMAGDTFTTAIGQALLVEAGEAETLKRRYAVLSTEPEAPAAALGRAAPSFRGTAPPRPQAEPADLMAGLDDGPGAPMFSLDAEPAVGLPEFGGDEDLATEEQDASEPVAQALKPVVAELAAEIGRSLEYYRTRHDDVEVDKVILVGGSALIPNLAPVVQMELGDIPTEIGDPFTAVSFDPSGGYTPDQLAYMGPVVAGAVGLALYEWY